MPLSSRALKAKQELYMAMQIRAARVSIYIGNNRIEGNDCSETKINSLPIGQHVQADITWLHSLQVP